MAAVNLLADGAAANDSSEVVVAIGESVTIMLRAPEPNAFVNIMVKDDAAAYQQVPDRALSAASPMVSLNSPGTYLFRRRARTNGSCGVFRA